MFFTNDKVEVRHCFFTRIKSCWINFKPKRTKRTTILFLIDRMIYFIFSFLLVACSNLSDLNFLLNHFNRQSAANFSSVENISEIVILIFLPATANAQSLNCSNVLLSLNSICSHVR